ncbi:MAG TPA: ATP-binding cassette domain-containing protein [Nitrososphaerales archaeon]|nr:ATP-binding cassette domain-containing protein [Nitrososphaerales archaeon]
MRYRIPLWVVVVLALALLGACLCTVSRAQPSGEAASSAPGRSLNPNLLPAKHDGSSSQDAAPPKELTTTITLLPAANTTSLTSTSPPINAFPVLYYQNGTLQFGFIGDAPVSLATDAGTNVTIEGASQNGGLGAEDIDWVLDAGANPVNVTSGSTVTFYYYQVVDQLAWYSVVGGGNMPAPVLTYLGPPANASSIDQPLVNSTTLTTKLQDIEFTLGSNSSVTNPISANSTMRWATQTSSWQGTYLLPTPIRYYSQFNVSLGYSVTGGNGFSAPTVSCPSFGQLENYTAGTTAWVDAGTAGSPSSCYYPQTLPGSNGTERWAAQTSAVLAEGPGNITQEYYDQYALKVNYGVVGNEPPTPPSVNSTFFGVASTEFLSSPESVLWPDAGSSYSVTSPTITTPTERWQASSVVAGELDQPQSVSLTVYDQFLLSASYTVQGGGSPPAPTFTYLSLGNATTFQLSGVFQGFWADDGSSFFSNSSLNGSNSTDRWYSSDASGVVNQSANLLLVYNHQFILSVTGGDIGSQWFDSGTTQLVNVPGVFNRTDGVGRRVTSYSIDEGQSVGLTPTTQNVSVSLTMNGPQLLSIRSVEQFEVSLDPTSSSALASITSPTIGGDDYWYDGGTSVSVVLNGVWGRQNGTGYRLVSYSVDGETPTLVSMTGTVLLSLGSISSPVSLTSTSAVQYGLTVSQGSIVSLTPSTIPGDEGWYDSGAKVSVTLNFDWDEVAGQSRVNALGYALNGGPATLLSRSGSGNFTLDLTMSEPQAIVVDSVVQYSLTVSGGFDTRLNASSPTQDGFYDAGTELQVSTDSSWGLVNGSTRQGLVSYTLDGLEQAVSPSGSGQYSTPTIAVDSPQQLTFNSATQYLVTFNFTDSTGTATFSPSSFEITLNGVGTNLSASTSWVNSGDSVAVTLASWEGSQLTPIGSAGAQVTEPQTLTVRTDVYEASVKVVDLIGLPVSGAGVSVAFANGTSEKLVTAGNGLVPLGLVPAGDYQVSASNLGFTTEFTANPSVRAEAVATVPLSLPVLGVALAICVATFGTAFPRLSSRRSGRGSALVSVSVADEAGRAQTKEGAVVEFENVGCKIAGKTILREITLSARRGEIIGILGRNGAGKTTLLSLISGLRGNSSGVVTVLGERMPAHGSELRRRMGFVLQEDALYQESTVFENLRFSAGLYDVRNPDARILEVLGLLGLSDRKDQVVSTLSGGLRRRTAIARAFLHDPDLFIVDEPTLGVDADARHAVWAYLRLLRSKKRTVIVATNYLEEALALCDRVAVLSEGTLLAVEEPRELVRRTGSCIDVDCDSQTAKTIASGVAGMKQVVRADLTLSGVSLFLDKGANPDEVVRGLAAYGGIEGFRLRAPDLSEVFKSLAERR